jgi:hypothetical protein
MAVHNLRAVRTGVIACALLLIPGISNAQQTANRDSTGAGEEQSSPDLANEVRALSATVRELQAQVQSLNSELQEVRAKEGSLELDSALPPKPLPRASVEQPSDAPPSATNNPHDPYSTFPENEAAVVSQPESPASPNSISPAKSIEERLAQLEDDQQLDDSRLSDQDQTKVESGSKYRVRLSGIVLLNMFENRGTVDSTDTPEIALEPNPLDSAGTFGGTLRQSQIGVQAFGPDVAGARTSADVKFDFGGGFPNAPNGAVMGLIRFRTGTIRLDWSNTSIIAGQDFLFFAPLEPTSLAQFAIPALSYAGNLWGWTPQVRIEHRVNFSDHSNLLFAGGILDSLTGDLPYSQYDRYPSWGEESGQPAYAARLAWSGRILNQNFTVGEGGYYGRQYWGFGRHVDGWVASTDLTMPLGKYFAFTGEFYRGRAVGGLGGGIGQGVLINGSLLSPVTIQGLDSMGGWVQLKYKPVAKFEINAALGDDNPFTSEFKKFPGNVSYYGVNLTRNFSPFVNFIYQLRSDVMFSVEFRRLKTYQFEDDAYTANQTNISLGYIF